MSCSTTKTCAERISGISVESFLQLVASGIATGIIYGSLGLAFVIVFQATRTLNLAQGEIAALGTFGASHELLVNTMPPCSRVLPYQAVSLPRERPTRSSSFVKR